MIGTACDLGILRSDFWRSAAFPIVRDHIKRRVWPKNRLGRRDPGGGNKKIYGCRQKERGAMSNSLTKGTVQGTVIEGRLSTRTGRGLVDASRYVMNVGLRDIGLQSKSNRHKPDDKLPTLSFTR